jgi:hypothetical protein
VPGYPTRNETRNEMQFVTAAHLQKVLLLDTNRQKKRASRHVKVALLPKYRARIYNNYINCFMKKRSKCESINHTETIGLKAACSDARILNLLRFTPDGYVAEY